MSQKRNWLTIFSTILVALIMVSFTLSPTGSGLASQQAGHSIYLPILSRSLVPTVFGVETTDFASGSGVEMMLQAGTTWVRYNNVLWSDLQPLETQPPNWTLLDPLKKLLSSNANKRNNVILIVRYTPDWAEKHAGSTCGPILQNKFPAFAQFMHDIVLQLSVPPYNVKYWEIGNEPDAPYRTSSFDPPFGCWGEPGQPFYGGDYYGEMLQQVYPAIKSADPKSTVLIGGLLLDCDPDHPIYQGGALKDCSSGRFLEGILSSNNGHGGDFFDGVSYHAYDYFNDLGKYSNFNWLASSTTTGPTSLVKDQFIRGVLTKYGVANKLYLNTETALICTVPDCADKTTLIGSNFETTKAYYVPVDYASALVNAVDARVWYDIRGVWRYSGLTTHSYAPLPAYYAFKTAAAEFGLATFTKELTQFTGVKGYQFSRGKRVLWLLWSSDGKPHSVQLPRVPVLALDSLGNTITLAQGITVDINPHYYEWVGNP